MNLSRPMNGWGFSEGWHGYLAGSGAASSHSSMRRFLPLSSSCGYERLGGGRVDLAKQVLGGYWECMKPIGAREE